VCTLRGELVRFSARYALSSSISFADCVIDGQRALVYSSRHSAPPADSPRRVCVVLVATLLFPPLPSPPGRALIARGCKREIKSVASVPPRSAWRLIFGGLSSNGPLAKWHFSMKIKHDARCAARVARRNFRGFVANETERWAVAIDGGCRIVDLEGKPESPCLASLYICV